MPNKSITLSMHGGLSIKYGNSNEIARYFDKNCIKATFAQDGTTCTNYSSFKSQLDKLIEDITTLTTTINPESLPVPRTIPLRFSGIPKQIISGSINCSLVHTEYNSIVSLHILSFTPWESTLSDLSSIFSQVTNFKTAVNHKAPRCFSSSQLGAY